MRAATPCWSPSNPVRNIAGYPDEKVIEARLKEWPRHVILDAEKLAGQAGTARAVNSVILGAASAFLMIPEADVRACVEQFFDHKGRDIADKNLAAFNVGSSAANQVETVFGRDLNSWLHEQYPGVLYGG